MQEFVSWKTHPYASFFIATPRKSGKYITMQSAFEELVHWCKKQNDLRRKKQPLRCCFYDRLVQTLGQLRKRRQLDPKEQIFRCPDSSVTLHVHREDANYISLESDAPRVNLSAQIIILPNKDATFTLECVNYAGNPANPRLQDQSKVPDATLEETHTAIADNLQTHAYGRLDLQSILAPRSQEFYKTLKEQFRGNVSPIDYVMAYSEFYRHHA